jgi:pSer/pThr/pTyr-binding forkhead associated (FHA) protein
VNLIVLKNHVPISEIQIDTSDITEKYEIFVGRSDDCHVMIDDPLISRHHFVLKNEGREWYCQKLTQLGVVLVNGSAAPVAKINNGVEIRAGAYSVIVANLPAPQSLYQGPQNSTLSPPPASEPIEEVTSTPEVEETVVLQSEPEVPDEGGSLESNMISGDNFLPEEDQVENEDSTFTSDESLDSTVGEGGDLISGDEDFNQESSALDVFPDEGEIQSDHESTRVFQTFLNYQLVLFGEYAPYDRFQIDLPEIFIGRDTKKCQIVLNDPEVSSVHSVIRKINNDIILEDLNSSNGTILNGERINKAIVPAGSDFVIGSTTFTLEVRSDLLDAESDRLMPVESGQTIETEEFEEEIVVDEEGNLDFNAEVAQEKSFIKRIWKDPNQRKKLIYGAVVIAGIFLFLEDEPEEPKKPKQAPTEKVGKADEKKKPSLSKELELKRNMAYELGVDFFEQNQYSKAEEQFMIVTSIDPEYKKVQTYLEQTRLGKKRLAEMEAEKRAEEERIKLKKIIEELVVKAREAVKERQIQVAESYFNQITEKDPENFEVQQLKLELESWQKEQERIALEKASKEVARKRQVDALLPGKTFYLKREWYRATLKLEEFLRSKGMDEDLVKEASDMLADSKNQLSSELGPLLGKARSLKEGQDYKSAYEAFLEILKIEPTNAEALNEVDDIKAQLESRSKRIYREAIIAESLSLFADAKEKFQEVQQISPTDSEYYRKATDKLKNYME